jgi:translocation and assembly module TamB
VTEPSTKPARRRWWKYLLIIVAVMSVTAVGLTIYVNTDSFQALVRRRLIAELERVTGGRVEIGSIHTTPFRMQVDVRGITVHGRESATDVPLVHVDRIVARLKFNFLLRSELAFSEIILEQPVVHVALYPDGTSNFPPRKLPSSSSDTPVEQLFALSINHLEIRHGQILWDDQIIPVDFAARGTSLQMDYSFLHGRYDGRLLLGLVDTKLMDCRPFAWMTEVEFSLSSNSAVVPSIKWNSSHSHFLASGVVTDFRHPHLEGQYDGQFDLLEVASIARRHELRGGMLEVKGRGNWSLERFAGSGLLTVRDLAWQDERISFSKASVSTGYSVTDQQIELSKLQARIFGGTITGEAEWNQWLAPAQHLSSAARKNLETAVISAGPSNKAREKSANPKPPAVQNAAILLRLHDLSAEDLAQGLSSLGHPILRLHPAASASGTFDARWKGTVDDAEVQFAVDLTPPEHPIPAHMRISGHANGVYHAASHSLDLPQFTLTTPTSHVRASGTLSTTSVSTASVSTAASATSALHLSVGTSSLADWLPFLEVVRGPAMFPVTLNGSAAFNGSMSRSISSPQFAGSLEVDDFDFNVPATSSTHELKTHWDTLSTSIQFSFNGIALSNATLHREDTSAEFNASAALDHGHFTGGSVFTLRANVYNTDLVTLQALAGYNYPVYGKADLFIEGAGTFSDPHGDGKIHLTNGSAYGETIQQFDSSFHLERGEIAFADMHLIHDDSVVTGSAAYNPSSRVFHLDVVGNNFDLAQIRRVNSGRLSVEGRADFVLKGSGTSTVPVLTAGVHLRGLTLDGELAGDLDLQAFTKGDELRVTGNSQFQRGSLRITGGVQLHDDYPANLVFTMDQLDLDALWRSYLHGQVTGHSAVGGSVELRGPIRQPDRWIVDGTLTSLAIDVDNVKVHNQDPIRFVLAAQSLNVQQLHFVGDGTDFTAHGSVQLSGDRSLNVTADGHIDLKLLSTFDPDFTSSGQVAMNVFVGGTFADPLPQGTFQVSGGAVSYAGLPSGLSELNGSLLFTRDRIHIETLTARTGGGTLDLKGDATYFNQQLNINLTATGKDVRLRYPPGVSSTANAEIHWIGTRHASTVSGDISVVKMAVTPGFDFSAYLQRSGQFSVVTAANSPLNNVKLDIHVVTAPELQMRTAIARLSGDADLRLRGSVARPAVLGRVDILDGQATFHGTRFTLERGDITFTNPVAIEPQLNLQATTHVRSYDLNVTLTGTPSRGLNLNYRSEPPLPKSDIIALLALGRTNGESAQLQEQSGQSLFSDQASDLILNQALNDTASSRFQRLFGASNIKIDPQGLSTETNPISTGPQITIEQEFANNVSLTYSTNVSQSSQQIIQGEYYFNRSVSAVGTRDQNGVVSFDLRVRRRKK